MVRIRWLGAAGLECSTSEQTVLIDPYLSRVGKRRLLVGRPAPDEARVDAYLKTLPAPLSALLVGHTHVDHALDVPAFARRTDCPIVGSRSLDRLLRAYGLPDRVHVCEGGETLALGQGLRVQVLASRHGRVALGRVPYPGEVRAGLRPPLRTGDYRHGTVFAFRIELGGRALVHLGSAHVPSSAGARARGSAEQASPLERAQGPPLPPMAMGCDTLFCCVSGWRRLPGFVPRLLDALRPRVVVPFHWDDFTAPLREGQDPPRVPFVDVEGFVAAVARHAPGVAVQRVKVWEKIDL